MKREIGGGFLAIIGFVLSPISWWNDLFVNIPLAYIFALPFGFFSKNLFLPAMIAGYWITNVVGFMMLHHGVKNIFSKKKKKYTRKQLIKEIIISTIYTGIIMFFVLMGWLKFPTEYFS